jgi:hypothetical protein
MKNALENLKNKTCSKLNQTTPKLPKIDNAHVNVVAIVTTRSQQSEQ